MSTNEDTDEKLKRFATLGNQARLDLMHMHAPLKEIQAEHNLHMSCGTTGLQSLNDFVFRLLKSKQRKVGRAIHKVCKRIHFGACLLL